MHVKCCLLDDLGQKLLMMYMYEEEWKWFTQSSNNVCSQWIYVMC